MSGSTGIIAPALFVGLPVNDFGDKIKSRDEEACNALIMWLGRASFNQRLKFCEWLDQVN